MTLDLEHSVKLLLPFISDIFAISRPISEAGNEVQDWDLPANPSPIQGSRQDLAISKTLRTGSHMCVHTTH